MLVKPACSEKRAWPAGHPGKPGGWIHLKPNCGECCANSCHSQAHADFGLMGWIEHSSPCHHFTLPYLSPTLPLTCCSVLPHSRVSHVPAQALSLLQQHQVLQLIQYLPPKGWVFTPTEYIPQVCGMRFLSYSSSQKCLPAEHRESLFCCCTLTLYVLQLPRKGKSGEKSIQIIALNTYEEKEPFLE